MTILSFVLVMMVVVLIHEFGHFWVARCLSMTVEAFSVGFGKEIVGWTDARGTRWRLGWIPLGAYVKFYDQTDDPRVPAACSDGQARLVPFRSKPAWERIAVVAAGPAANILLAFGIYTTLNVVVGPVSVVPQIGTVSPGSPAASAGLRARDRILSIDGKVPHSADEASILIGTSGNPQIAIEVERNGDSLAFGLRPALHELSLDAATVVRWRDVGIRRQEPARLASVVSGSPADKAGLRAGDLVLAIDGTQVASYDDLVMTVAARPLQRMNFTVLRAGQILQFDVTPALIRQDGYGGENRFRGRIGVSCAPPKISLFQAAEQGFEETAANASQMLSGLGHLLSGKSSERLGGPIAIAQMTGEVADLGIIPLIRWTAVISISIGLLNLFPIPVLDGGRLLFYVLEIARRRPIDRRIEEGAYRLGLAAVLVVVVYANVNDLVSLSNTWPLQSP